MKEQKKCPNCGFLLDDARQRMISDQKIVITCSNCCAPLRFDAVEKNSKVKAVLLSLMIVGFVSAFLYEYFISSIGDYGKNLIFVFFALYILVSGISNTKIKISIVSSSSVIESIVGYMREEIRPYQRFLDQKIGAIDLLTLDSEFRKDAGFDGLLSSALKIHNERIGGLSVEEQNKVVSQLKPDVNLMELVGKEVEKVETQIKKLKSFVVE